MYGLDNIWKSGIWGWKKKVNYNFDPYNVLLAIATNITAFVLQGHICLELQLC